MTDPSHPRAQFPLSAEDIAEGEQYAEQHDPGRPEQYAGDPWEETPDGDLDPGPLPGQPEE